MYDPWVEAHYHEWQEDDEQYAINIWVTAEEVAAMSQDGTDAGAFLFKKFGLNGYVQNLKQDQMVPTYFEVQRTGTLEIETSTMEEIEKFKMLLDPKDVERMPNGKVRIHLGHDTLAKLKKYHPDPEIALKHVLNTTAVQRELREPPPKTKHELLAGTNVRHSPVIRPVDPNEVLNLKGGEKFHVFKKEKWWNDKQEFELRKAMDEQQLSIDEKAEVMRLMYEDGGTGIHKDRIPDAVYAKAKEKAPVKKRPEADDLLNEVVAACYDPVKRLFAGKAQHDDRASRRHWAKVVDPDLKSYAKRLRAARAMQLDTASVDLIQKLAKVDPSVIAERIEMATLPFPTTWVEWTWPGFAERYGALLEEDKKDPALWHATFFSTMEDGRVMFMPVTMMLDTQRRPAPHHRSNAWALRSFRSPKPNPEYDKNINTWMTMMDAMMWNYSVPIESFKEHRAGTDGNVDIPVTLITDAEGGDHLRIMPDELNVATWGMEDIMWQEYGGMLENAERHIKDRHLHPDYDPAKLFASFMDNMKVTMKEMAGDMRFLVSMLATINHVPVEYTNVIKHREHTRLVGASHRVPYLVNSVVKLAIPAKKQVHEYVSRVLGQEARKRKRHEVRAHYRVSDRQVNEKWEPFHDPDKGGQLRYRLRIKSFYRGDASLGFVSKKYDVTASRNYDPTTSEVKAEEHHG